MTKITLNDLSTISGNEQSAINLINANNAVIETASDNTLSRDGTSPNQMLSSLDMNSFRILNCVDAINVTEPATYGQVLSFISSALTPGTPLLGTGVATWLTTPTSANLKAAVTDETGSGVLVFNTSPTFVTPILGTATATGLVITGLTFTATAANAGLELGLPGTSNTPFIDFHSSASVTDYDSRLIATVGTASSGQGFLNIDAQGFVPFNNNTTALGTSSVGWSQLYMASGSAINWNNSNVTLTQTPGVLTSNAAWVQTGPMRIESATAIPAGGTAFRGYRFSSVSDFGIFFGSGAPTLSAAQGSIYLRSDGGANTRIYSNNNGTTGWSPMTG